MEFKVVMYILIAVAYYGFQAYKKFSENKKVEPIPENKAPKKNFQREKTIQTIKPEQHWNEAPAQMSNTYEINKELELKYNLLESENTVKFAFQPSVVEEAIKFEDSIQVKPNYVIEKKNQAKTNFLELIKNKKGLKSALIFNEVMQKKF